MTLRRGASADYRELQRFHYRIRPPATWAAVLCITYTTIPTRASQCRPARAGRPIAVGVLSWPTAVSRPRREVFNLDAADFAAQVRFANQHVRTISRVIVHPQFRGLGLARLLIEALCAVCPTRYVEATAAMAAAHPMFQRAGMTRHDRRDEGPAYFWLDRSKQLPRCAIADASAHRGQRGV